MNTGGGTRKPRVLSTRYLCMILLVFVLCNVALHLAWTVWRTKGEPSTNASTHLAPQDSQFIPSHTEVLPHSNLHPKQEPTLTYPPLRHQHIEPPALITHTSPPDSTQDKAPLIASEIPPAESAPLPPNPPSPQPDRSCPPSQVFTQLLDSDPNKDFILQGTFPPPSTSSPTKPIARRTEQQPSFTILSHITTIDTLPPHVHTHASQFKLVIGINTITRWDKTTLEQQGTVPVDYLLRTLRSLKEQLAQLPIEQRKCVLVFVANFEQDTHAVFETAKQEFTNLEQDALHFVFYTAGDLRLLDPFDDIPGNNYFAPENSLPGHVARQQNADVLTLLSTVLRTIPNFEYFLFMEDDFLACDKSLEFILNDLHTIEKNPRARRELCGLRLSYGMTGIILDRIRLWYFAHYLSSNLDLLPVDLLIRKYMFEHQNRAPGDVPKRFGFCKTQNMSLFVHKDVLLEHIGETSTFSERNKKGFRPAFPGCGTSMARVWNLDGKERFNILCGRNEFMLSPCHYWKR